METEPNLELVAVGRRLRAEIDALTAERDKLQAFKDYVHRRLDEAGVPVDPPSPHKAEGCRIGGRLDAVFAERDSLRFARLRFARLRFARLRFCDSHALDTDPAARLLKLLADGLLKDAAETPADANSEPADGYAPHGEGI